MKLSPLVPLYFGTALGLVAACGTTITPAQEAAIEKGTCVVIDDVAGALGGPVAEGLVTIACDAVGAWVLTKLDADSGAPPPPATVAPLRVHKVSRRACVAAGICAHVVVDAGGGG